MKIDPQLVTIWALAALGVHADIALAVEPSSRQESQALAVPNATTGWDAQAAAKYLDDRMSLWFEKADKLHTDKDPTSCVSCHTTIPYAMARAALRKAAGQTQATPQETKLLGETVRRVNTYDSHETLYESKDEQSRGTEAVLNLLILAAEDARQHRHDPSETTRKALQELWKRQRPDGAWNWLDFANEPYESKDSLCYGVALAAFAVGTVPGYAGAPDADALSHIAKLRDYLSRAYPSESLYNRVWMLLASARLDGVLSRDQREALTAQLMNQQNADGGWSLHALGPWTWSKASPPFEPKGKPDASLFSKSDGYATGLVTYALRQSGLPSDHAALKKGSAWLAANQRECEIDQARWNCWRTYSLNYDREHGGKHGDPWSRMFMSDAATAFAVLALLPVE
jgi:hypothetical protein